MDLKKTVSDSEGNEWKFRMARPSGFELKKRSQIPKSNSCSLSRKSLKLLIEL